MGKHRRGSARVKGGEEGREKGVERRSRLGCRRYLLSPRNGWGIDGQTDGEMKQKDWRQTQRGSKRQQETHQQKMWPAAQAADRVRDAVRPGGRQGQRPRATWEDTGVEGRKRPRGDILSPFSPQGSRGDTGGMQEGIEVAEAETQEGEWTPAPPTHLPPGWDRDHRPSGGLVAEGSEVRGRVGVPGPGFGGPPLTVQPLG